MTGERYFTQMSVDINPDKPNFGKRDGTHRKM